MVTICTATKDLSSGSVTTATWVQIQLVDENGSNLSPNVVPYHCNQVQVSNPSSSVIAVGVGVTGGSTAKRVFLVMPNEILEHPIILSPGLGVFVKAVDTTADQGVMSFTFQKGKA